MAKDRLRRCRLTAAAAPTLLALALLAPTTTFAADEPNGAASCMGIEHASISPPGTSDEEPGGSGQFVQEVKDAAAQMGVPAGAFMSFIASLHSGSHEACDEALGGGDSDTSSGAAAIRTTRLASRSTGSAVIAVRRGPRVD
jgi:hypothetical protein